MRAEFPMVRRDNGHGEWRWFKPNGGDVAMCHCGFAERYGIEGLSKVFVVVSDKRPPGLRSKDYAVYKLRRLDGIQSWPFRVEIVHGSGLGSERVFYPEFDNWLTQQCGNGARFIWVEYDA